MFHRAQPFAAGVREGGSFFRGGMDICMYAVETATKSTAESYICFVRKEKDAHSLLTGQKCDIIILLMLFSTGVKQ